MCTQRSGTNNATVSITASIIYRFFGKHPKSDIRAPFVSKTTLLSTKLMMHVTYIYESQIVCWVRIKCTEFLHATEDGVHVCVCEREREREPSGVMRKYRCRYVMEIYITVDLGPCHLILDENIVTDFRLSRIVFVSFMKTFVPIIEVVVAELFLLLLLSKKLGF